MTLGVLFGGVSGHECFQVEPCSRVCTEAKEDVKTKRNNKRLAKNRAARLSRRRNVLKANRARGARKGREAEAWENWDQAGEDWEWECGNDDEAWAWDGSWYEMDSGACKKRKKLSRVENQLDEGQAGEEPGNVSEATHSKKRPSPKAKAVPAEPKGKRTRITPDTAGPPDAIVVNELLKLLWYYDDVKYEDTGLNFHAQRWANVRLNIYWSRNEVGITIKKFQGTNKPKDVCSFTVATTTIATHLYMANIVARG